MSICLHTATLYEALLKFWFKCTIWFKVLKDLWELGLKCNCVEATNFEDVQEWLSELHVPHLIILKDTERGVIRLRNWESDRFHEQKINTSDLINTLRHKLKTRQDSMSEQQNSNVITYTRSETKINTNDKCDHVHENTINILIVTEHDDKLPANNRRRYESQVRIIINSVVFVCFFK